MLSTTNLIILANSLTINTGASYQPSELANQDNLTNLKDAISTKIDSLSDPHERMLLVRLRTSVSEALHAI